MAFNRFGFFMVLRVALIFVSLMGLNAALTNPGYYGLTLLLGLITAGLLVELYRYVNKTNMELTRFLDAARYGDFGQRFQAPGAGASFDKLTKVFTEIMQSFKDSRQEQEETLRHLKSLTEHIPVPLLSLYPDGHIQLHNNAARRLFSGVTVNRLEDLRFFSGDFLEAVKDLQPGRRRLLNFAYDGMERQLTAVMSQIVTGNITEKLISMQDIQSELDHVQLHAWQDLVRVLTHEIMNSITPVASLATTARDLVDELSVQLKDKGPEDVLLEDFGDVRSAVDTVARRSTGLMQFVQSYRSLTQLPTPQKQNLSLLDLLKRVQELFANSWNDKGIQLNVKVEPVSLQLAVDADMLEQVLINLLQNAEQALVNSSNPQVSMKGRLNQRGHVLLEVADNGPGIPADIAGQVFVPFFTTKAEGSGVGLALTRQVMSAHGGNVTARNSDQGGATFTLIF